MNGISKKEREKLSNLKVKKLSTDGESSETS